MILSINRDYVPEQHYPADLCAGVELCVCMFVCVCVCVCLELFLYAISTTVMLQKFKPAYRTGYRIAAVSNIIRLFILKHTLAYVRQSRFEVRALWSRGLRRGSAAACLLGLRVRIPSGGTYVCLL